MLRCMSSIIKRIKKNQGYAAARLRTAAHIGSRHFDRPSSPRHQENAATVRVLIKARSISPQTSRKSSKKPAGLRTVAPFGGRRFRPGSPRRQQSAAAVRVPLKTCSMPFRKSSVVIRGEGLDRRDIFITNVRLICLFHVTKVSLIFKKPSVCAERGWKHERRG